MNHTMKRIKYIPIDKINEYIKFLTNNHEIDFKLDMKFCEEE